MNFVTLFFLLFAAAAKPDFTLKIPGYFVRPHEAVRVTIHIPYRDQNRHIELVWDGELGDGGSSDIDLTEVDHITHRVTFERNIYGDLPGAHRVQAILHATDGNRMQHVEFTVIE